MTSTSNRRPKVVVIGAGFAGMNATEALRGVAADILVIDRNNYHTFPPLLYQVAAAELEADSICRPIRSVFRGYSNVDTLMSEVRAIDLSSKKIETTSKTVEYDYLVLAAGSVSRYYNTPGVEGNVFELKSLEMAVALRNHIMCCFEQAASEPDHAKRLPYLTFVIAGGGATGVEFAGALSELVQRPIVKDYPMFGLNDVKIMIIQGMHDLLPEMPERLREYTLRTLRKKGVDVHLDTLVTSVSAEGVVLNNGSNIQSKTVVWTAGVRGQRIAEDTKLPMSKDMRVRVLPTLQVPDHPEVYIAGDLAYWEHGGHPLPFTAPVAVQEGRAAGLNIARQMAGQDPLPFTYKSKGAAAVIGRGAAIIDLGSSRFTGFPAWILWLLVHIFNLISFRSRVLVMIDWAWDFLFYERGNRLILPSDTCRPAKEEQ